MSETTIPRDLTELPAISAPGWLARLTRPAVLRTLRGLREGCLVIEEMSRGGPTGGGRMVFGDAGSDLRATVRVHDPSFWPAVALRGSVGAGEAFIDGLWTTDDIVAVVRIFVRNREVLDGMEEGLAKIAAPFLRMFHARRGNSKDGSRRNIAAHYDLGNEFFELFLDETLMYSCAYFERENQSLSEASAAKNDRLCTGLGLRPSDHLVEIGTGWGGMAIHAASRYGCRVTTTTISRRQHDLAQERVRRAGLADRVTVLLEDYRDLKGTFDALVSIEMVEAVGAAHLDTWTRTCGRLLSPAGRLAVQAIVIRDDLYDRALRNVDFIQRHVFPGSFIPSTAVLRSSFARTTALRPVRIDDIGPHYVRTLRLWRERFLAQTPAVEALGLGTEFRRLWEFYLAYCEGGFAERALSDVQMFYAMPDAAARRS